jgi:hypothetical protein
MAQMPLACRRRAPVHGAAGRRSSTRLLRPRRGRRRTSARPLVGASHPHRAALPRSPAVGAPHYHALAHRTGRRGAARRWSRKILSAKKTKISIIMFLI